MANLDLIIWDVQHGNAIYVRTPNNRHFVFDLGIGDYSGHNQQFSPLSTLWHTYGVRTIDVLTITHPHLDHIDDILNVPAFNPKVLYRPRNLTKDDVMKNIRDQDRSKFEKYFQLGASYISSLDGSPNDPRVEANYGGLKFRTFATPSLPKDNLNNHSIITVLEYLGGKIVIPGDNECESLTLLMQDDDFKSTIKDCDVLIAPHHGRESAFHQEFVSLANPYVTVISDGSICDTSANFKYSASSKGWNVWKKGTSNSSQRKLLTTNSDGEVFVTISPSNDAQYARTLTVQIQ